MPAPGITIPKTDNGSVSVDNTNPSRGDEVTITVTPDEDYEAELTITDILTQWFGPLKTE